MSFGAPSPPPVQDPYKVAGAQQEMNLEMLKSLQAASNVNQITPTGSLTYQQTGVGPNGVPTYTATQTLSPENQALLTQLQKNATLAGGQANAVLSGANYGAEDPSKVIGNSASGEVQRLLAEQTKYMDPYFTAQTDQLDTKLRNQGLFPGMPAYDNAMMASRDTQNRAISNFIVSAQPQAYDQAYRSYMTPLQIAATEYGLSQPTPINLTQTPQAQGQPANLVGAVNNAQQAEQANYQAQLSQQNNMLSGLFGLGGAALNGGSGGFGASLLGSLFMSDERTKEDIEQIGLLNDGQPLFRFRYKHDPEGAVHVGLMAQEVEKIRPDAVVEIGGIKHVDYDRATEGAGHGH